MVPAAPGLSRTGEDRHEDQTREDDRHSFFTLYLLRLQSFECFFDDSIVATFSAGEPGRGQGGRIPVSAS